MNASLVTKSLLGASALGLGLSAGAATAWDEAVNGDLSGNHLAPTFVAMALGSNVVVGDIDLDDLDYFSFTVPRGSLLSAMVMLGNTTVVGGASFLALQVGPQITAEPSGEDREFKRTFFSQRPPRHCS